MQTHRQELWRSAIRRTRRGRKTTGRIVVSALGFGTAYYLDTDNGAVRRKKLLELVQRGLRQLKAELAPHVAEPPAVFPSVLRSRPDEMTSRNVVERLEAVR
jgi:hypothetical protein